ncbi:hypothetical protein [Glycomyces harbinensis]|uniref:Uncharacterized protein n=1 Tax=Glycomyces harbinensis TaxID=58114 RepID=A0A1G7DVE4_9ACTN|nr:hypothetical protein [Glycomyces harbinensis]SDE55459.1 hypothetical protein SAMN05216270_12916 [Glycomyces harbinensis]
MSTDEPLFTFEVTRYEAELLRQMVALEIHDYKSGSIPGDPQDPEFARRRVADCEALL